MVITMKHELDLSSYQVRTDLLKDYKREIKSVDNIKVESIFLDKESSLTINKKSGIYKTVILKT